MTPAIGLAVLAALLFGAGTALQGHAAAGGRPAPHPPGRTGNVLHLGSLARVAVRPLWLAGTVLDWLGALTHIAALHFGPLALVQPLTLTAIVCAVPAEAVLANRRPSRRQMAAAVQTALGLVLLALFWSRDQHGGPVEALTSGAGVAGAVLGIAALVLASTRCHSHRLQALLLGAAAGSAYGLSDATARAVQVPGVTHFSGPVDILAGGTALTAGGLGRLLTHAARQKSRLSSSMPAQDLLALLVSIALGATLLGEVPHLTGSLLAGTTVALASTGHGIVQLSRTLPHATTSPRLDHRIPIPEMAAAVTHDDTRTVSTGHRRDPSGTEPDGRRRGTRSGPRDPSPLPSVTARR